MPEEIRAKALLGSAAIPFVFPPIEIGDWALVDGGTFQNLDIGDPIDRCREQGFEDSQIVIDILMCLSDYPEVPHWDF